MKFVLETADEVITQQTLEAFARSGHWAPNLGPKYCPELTDHGLVPLRCGCASLPLFFFLPLFLPLFSPLFPLFKEISHAKFQM